MASPASFLKHPIHVILVPFPLGLWTFSFVCDLVNLFGWGGPVWKEVAFYTMAGGIIGALLAAVPGFIDYLSLTDRRAKQIATTHMVLNLIIVVLFIFNLGVRYNAAPAGELFGVALSVIGIAMMSVSGWLGGSLVYVHRVAVAGPREKSEIERRAA